MGEQHADGDVVDGPEAVVDLTELRKPARDGVVEREAAAIAQLHDRDRGQGLRDRRPVVDGGGIDRRAGGSIAQPEVVAGENPAVPQHGDGPPDHAIRAGEPVERTR